jgi:hypothetical protein
MRVVELAVCMYSRCGVWLRAATEEHRHDAARPGARLPRDSQQSRGSPIEGQDEWLFRTDAVRRVLRGGHTLEAMKEGERTTLWGECRGSAWAAWWPVSPPSMMQ